jgi:hypothetical protein
MKFSKLLVMTGVLVWMTCPAFATTFIIDDFSAGDWHLGRDAALYGLDPLDYPTWVPVPVPGSATVETEDAGILGSNRTMSLERAAGYAHSPTVDASTWLGGSMTFNSSWDGSVATWSLAYGLQGDLNADFTQCNNDRIRIHGGGQFETYLNGTGGDATPLTVTIISGQISAFLTMDLRGNPDQSETYFDFMLDEFVGIDPTDVDQLILTFGYCQANAAVDYGISSITLPSGCDNNVAEADDFPTDFILEQNYPNPFNPTTNISFSLYETSKVSLYVFDAAGRTVATLADGLLASGVHELSFDAVRLSSGVYFYTLEADGNSLTRKMILMK